MLLTACSAATPSPSVTPALTLRDLQVEPLGRTRAGIAFAFDAAAAGELVESVPAGLDFGASALVCVYLGERPTTGWGLELLAAHLLDGELRITALERRPRANTDDVLTYPADCASLNRAALPVGELVVRADDTISDEFIVDGVVTVPPPPAAP
ncbi:MAG: protease complex subunit PrcB family protein [Candidatus Limnocylindria bacterium]